VCFCKCLNYSCPPSPLFPSFSPSMFSLLGRSALFSPSSSFFRLSPVYRIPLTYPVGSGYRNPISYRASSTTSDGGSYEDFGPIPPIILYTDGIRGSDEQGAHMGLGIFVEENLEMTRSLSVMRKRSPTVCEKTPELQAIRFALFLLYKSPNFLMEDVIIRTRFDPIVDEFENWRKGDLEGARSLMDVWRQMDRFPNVRIERADMMDDNLHVAIDLAIDGLEKAEKIDAKEAQEPRIAPAHLRHSLKFPLSLPSKKKDEKKKEEDEE
ncbi:hypothetical protein PENTCL1PPCAC_4114, partial [Pristionchus entomophagus]